MRRIVLFQLTGLCLAAAASAAEPPAPPEPQAIPLSSSSAPAVEAFQRGRDLFESSRELEARALFEKAVALDPQFAFAHAMLARCLSGEAATKQMDRAEALAGALGPAEQAMIAYWRGQQRGDESAADAALTRLAEVAADDWRVELLLGERAVDEGKGEDAVHLFRRAIELNPDAAEAFNHLGFALADLGQHDAAITSLRRYAALKRDDPNPLDSLGEVLLRANRLEDAEASFSKASLNPQFWYAAAGVATARFFRGDFKGGQDAIRKELAVAPDAAARVRLATLGAWSLLAQGQRADGLAALDAAEQDARTSSLPALHAQLAVSRAAFHVLSGDPAAALPLLDAAIQRTAGQKLSGADEVALWRSAAGWRIRSLAASGRMEEAARELQALERDAAAPGNAVLSSLVRGLRPVVSEAKGDLAAAYLETARCAAVDWLCRMQRIRLADRRGDHAGAEEGRRALVAERRRDPIWTSLQPSYLWVWFQLRSPVVSRN